jgi:hypothetical protein
MGPDGFRRMLLHVLHQRFHVFNRSFRQDAMSEIKDMPGTPGSAF